MPIVREKFIRAFLAALLLAGSLRPAGAAGEIYRWVDAEGITHLTQDAPVGRPYKRFTPDAAPSSSAPPARKAAAEERGEGELNKTREAGLRLRAETLERCAKARERIGFLQEKTARRLFRTGADGQPARYTDEEFETELRKAEGEAEQTCT